MYPFLNWVIKEATRFPLRVQVLKAEVRGLAFQERLDKVARQQRTGLTRVLLKVPCSY